MDKEEIYKEVEKEEKREKELEKLQAEIPEIAKAAGGMGKFQELVEEETKRLEGDREAALENVAGRFRQELSSAEELEQARKTLEEMEAKEKKKAEERKKAEQIRKEIDELFK